MNPAVGQSVRNPKKRIGELEELLKLTNTKFTLTSDELEYGYWTVDMLSWKKLKSLSLVIMFKMNCK